MSRAVAGLALIAAVSACDDNPLAENRERGEYFRLNPSDAVVNVGGTSRVVANVLNRYGAALVVSITATECDAKVSVAPDTVRSDYEYPERFVITGVSHGESCIVVRGGGLTDTIRVRVVPASIAVSAPDTLAASGGTLQLGVNYRSTTGAAAPGVDFDTLRTTFVVRTAGIGVVNRQGEFSGQAPGTTWVVSTFTDLGVTRRDSIRVTVVPGPFTGSVAQTAYQAGQALVFTAGAIAFDADTEVRYSTPDMNWVQLNPNTATTARSLLPFGLPAGTVIDYQIVNMGPNQIAAVGSFTTTAATPMDDGGYGSTPVALTPGVDHFGTLGRTRGSRERYVFTVATAGTYRLTLQWNDGGDNDAYIRNATTGATLLTLEGNASVNPETGTIALTPGTYWADAEVWTTGANPAGAQTTYRIRVVRQ